LKTKLERKLAIKKVMKHYKNTPLVHPAKHTAYFKQTLKRRFNYSGEKKNNIF